MIRSAVHPPGLLCSRHQDQPEAGGAGLLSFARGCGAHRGALLPPEVAGDVGGAPRSSHGWGRLGNFGAISPRDVRTLACCQLVGVP